MGGQETNLSAPPPHSGRRATTTNRGRWTEVGPLVCARPCPAGTAPAPARSPGSETWAPKQTLWREERSLPSPAGVESGPPAARKHGVTGDVRLAAPLCVRARPTTRPCALACEWGGRFSANRKLLRTGSQRTNAREALAVPCPRVMPAQQEGPGRVGPPPSSTQALPPRVGVGGHRPRTHQHLPEPVPNADVQLLPLRHEHEPALGHLGHLAQHRLVGGPDPHLQEARPMGPAPHLSRLGSRGGGGGRGRGWDVDALMRGRPQDLGGHLLVRWPPRTPCNGSHPRKAGHCAPRPPVTVQPCEPLGPCGLGTVDPPTGPPAGGASPAAHLSPSCTPVRPTSTSETSARGLCVCPRQSRPCVGVPVGPPGAPLKQLHLQASKERVARQRGSDGQGQGAYP